MNYFIQDGPRLSNQYLSDEVLQNYVTVKFNSILKKEWTLKFQNFGDRVIQDILDHGHDALDNQPELVQYDAWGNRVDVIKVSTGWNRLKDISAEEGLISIGYGSKYGSMARVIQFIKLYLFTPSSAIYTCPLAMTDGAARVLTVLGDQKLKEKYLPKLLSRDKEVFWVSGQWMTEKTGGSDLAKSETIATNQGDHWSLEGPKWFTSAITSQMAMTLARIKNENGDLIQGSRGLSLFMLELQTESGGYNNLRINKLKDKLGTRGLPTGEIDLIGSKAYLIGDLGKGVKNIAIMLNITRIYNSISAVSLMRRAFCLARDYSEKRYAFGKRLIDLPLHAKTLSNCYVQFTGCFHFTFYVIKLLGKSETGESSSEEDAILRLMTPVVKLYTAKQAISVISELLESMGGAGFLEETQFPELLRDSQVLSIWEGTTNVLSLDVLRSIFKENSFDPLVPMLISKLDNLGINELASDISIVKNDLGLLKRYFESLPAKDSDLIESDARELSFILARTLIAALLLEFTSLTDNKSQYIQISRHWIRNNPNNFESLSHPIDENRTILDI